MELVAVPLPRAQYIIPVLTPEFNYAPVCALQNEEPIEGSPSRFRTSDKEKTNLAMGNTAQEISTMRQKGSGDIENMGELVLVSECDILEAISDSEKNNSSECPIIMSQIKRLVANVDEL